MLNRRLTRIAISVGLGAGVLTVASLFALFIQCTIREPLFKVVLYPNILLLIVATAGLVGAAAGTYLLVRRHRLGRATHAALGAFLACSGMAFLFSLLPFVVGGAVLLVTNAFQEALVEVALFAWVLAYTAGIMYLVASGEIASVLAQGAASGRAGMDSGLAFAALALGAAAAFATSQRLYAISIAAAGAALFLAVAAVFGGPHQRGHRRRRTH